MEAWNRFTAAFSLLYGGGSATWKSAALSALLPNGSHPLQRPVLSHARACQRYAVLLASPVARADT